MKAFDTALLLTFFVVPYPTSAQDFDFQTPLSNDLDTYLSSQNYNDNIDRVIS